MFSETLQVKWNNIKEVLRKLHSHLLPLVMLTLMEIIIIIKEQILQPADSRNLPSPASKNSPDSFNSRS